MISGDEPAMPPDKPLDSATIVQIREWIAALPQDAVPRPSEAESHWAWKELDSTQPPSNQSGWTRNQIDQFVLPRMTAAGLAPSPEADVATLARRLSLDLTGLPPTLVEVDRLVKDAATDRNAALQRFTRELMISPHFGEHWGRYWLDLARYADSNGYDRDQQRPMWMYRDWVINAFNNNMPFDVFTVRQLAGDLLPKPTKANLIASGFHRNSMFNQESGADDNEFRTHAVADRAETTATVWLGLTLRCARCHNHPNEPITQREYYRFFAFFNSTSDRGAARFDPPLPLRLWPSREQRDAMTAIQSDIDDCVERMDQGDESLKIHEELGDLRSDYQRLLLESDSTLVMEELDVPRMTTVLLRGDPSHPGPRVTPGVPRIFPNWSNERSRNRLGLAEWLVTDAARVTSRVTVNRIWGRLFGNALARSAENLGTQGEPPSHPQLLDWLAGEFIATEWSVKHVIELMVSSATYRQSSIATDERIAADPQNRLLARASRYRLDGEIVRDNALAISGLLYRRVGGRSVFPPQPEGIWDDIEANAGSDMEWVESSGADRYRRGLYTFWRRSMPHPFLTTFDAPQREECTVVRDRTNTPLQALAAMNEPVMVEAAEKFAQRIGRDSSGTVHLKLVTAFRLCVSRFPTPDESAVLLQLWEQEFHAASGSLLAELVQGESADDVRSAAEAQAWRVTTSVLLNLDATLTRW